MKKKDTDIERGDQPYRHRWEFINRDDDENAGGSALAIDVFKCLVGLTTHLLPM